MTLPEHDNSHETFRAARDLLLLDREDYDSAMRQYVPPRLEHFNWGLDWFDVVAGSPQTGRARALWVVEEDGTSTQVTYAEMADRSSQLAAWLQAHGVDRGDRLLLMLGNQVELWETLLACIKLGVVVIPASTLLAAADLQDRVHRGHVSHVVARTRGHRQVRRRGRRLDPHRGRGRRPGLAVLRGQLRAPGHLHPRGRHPGRRAAAALLHLRDDGAAQARRAHPRVLPGGSPVDACTGSGCSRATCT